MYNQCLILSESLFKKKKSPDKTYLTKQELNTLVKDGMNIFNNSLSTIKKEYGKTITITTFKEDYKVNKKVTVVPIGIISVDKTEMKKIIRDEISKYKTPNKLYGGAKIENMGKGVALVIKLKNNDEYYYWED